ncbi:MAG: hypothetical protein KDJ48_04910 [Nitratireductor sp.]|nr:hypothetical protein [Nitratireductor sp.]
MNAIRLLISLAGFGLAVLIVLSILNGDFWAEGSSIYALWWGKTTLADLYLGFALTAVVIWLVEKTLAARLFWIVPLFFLGNVWSALWLVLRLPRMVSALARR